MYKIKRAGNVLPNRVGQVVRREEQREAGKLHNYFTITSQCPRRHSCDGAEHELLRRKLHQGQSETGYYSVK